jgi:hypothetical protein
MVKGLDNTKTKKKTWKNKIERDQLFQRNLFFQLEHQKALKTG